MNSTFFPNAFTDSSTGLGYSDIAFRLIGATSPPIVNTIYPMEFLTKFHYAHHIPGLTGRWMDTGATALGGAVKGSFHRLVHGHHLLEDGFKVLVNSKLKFGEFLHHLGLDLLTKRGIPNPFLPTILGQKLVDIGLKQQFVYELMTINVPKILSGGLGLVCAGTDVFMAFSDAIPHTFMSAGSHLLFGSLDIVFGLYPPNFLLLTAGTMELGVGFVSAARAIFDPVIPGLGIPGSVFLPLLGQSVLLASVIGACVSYFTGGSWEDMSKAVVSSASAATTSTIVSLAAAGSGFIAPFIGPTAGIFTFLLVKKLLDTISESITFKSSPYIEYNDNHLMKSFNDEMCVPFLGCPSEPIGMLKGDLLILNEKSIRDQAHHWLV